MAYVFLSYCRRDQGLAAKISESLDTLGFEVWVDEQAISGGSAWRSAIVSAIAECGAFVILLSPQSVSSKNVIKELSIAEDKDRRIIPVLCEACTIPQGMTYALAGIQYIDFTEVEFETGVQALARALSGDDNKRKPPRAVAATSVRSSRHVSDTRSDRRRDLKSFLCGQWEAIMDESDGSSFDKFANNVFGAEFIYSFGANGDFKLRGRAGGLIPFVKANGTWSVAPTGEVLVQVQLKVALSAPEHTTSRFRVETVAQDKVRLFDENEGGTMTALRRK